MYSVHFPLYLLEYSEFELDFWDYNEKKNGLSYAIKIYTTWALGMRTQCKHSLKVIDQNNMFYTKYHI